MTETPAQKRHRQGDAKADHTERKTLADLIVVMAALRTPVTGCPWDLEQNFATIAPYTIEEAYEVADAIARGDMADLEEELGDLLLQVVYHARMAEEDDLFDFDDVADAVTRKMIRRHPHVFGSPEERAAGAQPDFWARIKAEEKAEKSELRRQLSAKQHGATTLATPATPEDGGSDTSRAMPTRATSLLADVPLALPALSRAIKLQDKAARVGFDWPSIRPVFDKMREELAELEEVAVAADPRGEGKVAHADSFSPGGEGARMADEGDFGSAPGATEAPSPQPTRQRDTEPDLKRIEEELGDLLFVMANVARHLKLDPEKALRGANEKFTRRFLHIEQRLAGIGKSPAESNLAEMDALWDEARAADKSPGEPVKKSER